MDQKDIETVRRVRSYLTSQLKSSLKEKKLDAYDKWINDNNLKECDFTFCLVNTHSNDYEDNYIFEMLFECKYKVGIHFTFGQYTNKKNFMSEYINEIHPRKHIHPEAHRLRVIGAIRKDPKLAYQVACNNEDLFAHANIDEIVKQRLFNL